MARFRAFMILALALLGPGFSAAFTIAPTSWDAPVTFHPGSDANATGVAGFLESLAFSSDRTAYDVALRGLSGATIVIDSLVETRADATTPYSLEAAERFQGDLRPETFMLRAWTGERPPQDGRDPGVCAVLDLLHPEESLTTAPCQGPARIQVVLTLPPDAAGTGSASIRPATIGIP